MPRAALRCLFRCLSRCLSRRRGHDERPEPRCQAHCTWNVNESALGPVPANNGLALAARRAEHKDCDEVNTRRIREEHDAAIGPSGGQPLDGFFRSRERALERLRLSDGRAPIAPDTESFRAGAAERRIHRPSPRACNRPDGRPTITPRPDHCASRLASLDIRASRVPACSAPPTPIARRDTLRAHRATHAAAKHRCALTVTGRRARSGSSCCCRVSNAKCKHSGDARRAHSIRINAAQAQLSRMKGHDEAHVTQAAARPHDR
ncbi:hypothetical protein X946_1917 [Burkholderia sp. ABCPW 111]|nr:hypothetical protein X946_1917 [Burkholderia sp. ABCPW 111]